MQPEIARIEFPRRFERDVIIYVTGTAFIHGGAFARRVYNYRSLYKQTVCTRHEVNPYTVGFYSALNMIPLRRSGVERVNEESHGFTFNPQLE